jgi:hypothetical protein
MLKQFVFKQLARAILSAFIAVWGFLVSPSTIFAQLSPPISPWMQMMDRSRTPGQLDNYNRFIRPQQEMMREYAAQASQLQSQQQALQALQNAAGGGTGSGSGVRDLAAPSGSSSGAGGTLLLSPPREIPRAQRNPAGFNQYLHYYPAASMPRKPVPNFSATGRR